MPIYGTYIGNDLMLIAPKYGARLLVSAKELHVMPLLVTQGLHEGGLTNFLIKNIKPGMRTIDVGSQYGYFTVLMGYKVGKQGEVHAFEPNPETFEILLKNISMNYVGDSVNLYELAVGSYKGEALLKWSEWEQSCASIKTQISSLNLNKHEKFVRVDTLDNRVSGDFDLIKIDAEASEYDVMQGAKETFKRTKWVVFELNKTYLGDDHGKLFGLLEQYKKSNDFYSIDMEGEKRMVDLDYLRNLEFHAHVLMEAKQ